jgi:hypothetical protein
MCVDCALPCCQVDFSLFPSSVISPMSIFLSVGDVRVRYTIHSADEVTILAEQGANGTFVPWLLPKGTGDAWPANIFAIQDEWVCSHANTRGTRILLTPRFGPPAALSRFLCLALVTPCKVADSTPFSAIY